MAEPKGAGDDPDKGAFRVELEALRNEIKKSEGITGSIAGWLGVGESPAGAVHRGTLRATGMTFPSIPDEPRM